MKEENEELGQEPKCYVINVNIKSLSKKANKKKKNIKNICINPC